jgi:tetratricopeptide (TPR) repeat protein
MNRNDFVRTIQDTSHIDRNMIHEIRELLNIFPYFQSAHLLLLKGLYDTSDIKFESQLKESAIYVADREVLYHYIKKEKNSAESKSESSKSSDSVNENYTDSQQTVIESGKNSQELINEIEKNNPDNEESRNIDYPLHGIPRSLLVREESDADDSVNIVFILEDEEENMEERIVFMDPSIIVPDHTDLLELDLDMEDTPGEAESYEFFTEADATKEAEKPTRKQEQADLIDKFIISNPRIEPVKDRSSHPVEDISKPFIEEKGGFITETLAKIYVNQGYYSKAIDIYEKLSLKFPEKSSYFATQIEKIKEFIKY